MAALASYPWLSCTGEQYEVRQTWDIDDRVFCPGREETFEFIEGVLDEVIGLFPSKYTHRRGRVPDEDVGAVSPLPGADACEGLTRPRQLQGYATVRVERFLQRHGRELIGWDEVLDGGVSPTAIVMSWRGTEGGIRAARQGNRVIMAPTTHCYFDYYQTDDTAVSRSPGADTCPSGRSMHSTLPKAFHPTNGSSCSAYRPTCGPNTSPISTRRSTCCCRGWGHSPRSDGALPRTITKVSCAACAA